MSELVTYANHGEDLEVLKFFGHERGVFAEAGANHPIEGSQTYLLEQQGWKGVLIEPIPAMAQLCRERRPGSQVFACALVEPGCVSHVRMRIPAKQSALTSIAAVRTEPGEQDEFFDCPARTLDAVLEESGIERLDFFSIDLEGYEAAALLGFNWKRWRPRLLSVEDHCESLATHRLVSANGYKLIRRIGDNHWYVPGASPHSMQFTDRMRFVRKMYLALPFRTLRRLSRWLRGKKEL